MLLRQVSVQPVMDDQVKVNQALVKIFDDLLEKGDWDASFVLKSARARIQSLRDEASALSQSIEASSSDESFFNHPEGHHITVYISLHHTDGRAQTRS